MTLLLLAKSAYSHLQTGTSYSDHALGHHELLFAMPHSVRRHVAKEARH